VYSRTIEAIQVKIPRLKATMRATFSRRGRCMLRRARIGRARIQRSVRMLKADVTVMEVRGLCRNQMI
jgi:hypothetical protein